MDQGLIGCLYTRGQGYSMHRLERWTWALDNECFSRAESFDLTAWLEWVATIPAAARESCLFATAPDVLGDSEATLERSLHVLPMIRAAGFPAAFVIQNGATDRVPWEHCDAVFVGGVPECPACSWVRPAADQAKTCPLCGRRLIEWKIGPEAETIVRHAVHRGKHVHMGRVNSKKRLVLAASWGCDSADGTFIRFAPDANLPRLLRWVDEVDRLKTEGQIALALW